MDKYCLLPGERWKDAIEREIKRSSYFLALLSDASVNKRGYVQKETRQALEVAEEFPQDQIFIIPARLNECKPSHTALNDLNWIDLFPSFSKNVIRLIEFFRTKQELARSGRPAKLITEGRMTGHIISLLHRGFGFISSDIFKKNIVFHASELRGVRFDELREGDVLEFYLSGDLLGMHAVSINVSRA